MDAKNCPRCGRVFSHPTKNVCANCEKADEDQFQTIREYIKENPLVTLGELSEATQVSVKRITQYIRDGRLEIAKGMQGDIGCERCGKPIQTGRYCPACMIDVNSEINTLFGRDMMGTVNKQPKTKSEHMFTLDKGRKS
jgi:flagellar operon protein (TIGR03826 family)